MVGSGAVAAGGGERVVVEGGGRGRGLGGRFLGVGC